MRNFEYKEISINDLYVNPENYRYIEDASDEKDAIIEMFKVTTGTPTKEMLNLSKDIVTDGLNPFEMPIVCFDEDLCKYIVYEGNRRITCIKLMTQYKNDEEILQKIPSVKEIYKLDCGIKEIQCVVYNSEEDAKHFLYKIHNDINEGIGRKQWDYHAKMKANAARGNKSKAYTIVEFLKTNIRTDRTLVREMNTYRWISKLERVLGFAKFREVYNVSFSQDNSLIYKDNEDHVVLMMSKLVYDLIHNSATNNFRFKDDFENYVTNLDDKYKTQITTDEEFLSETKAQTHKKNVDDKCMSSNEKNTDNSQENNNSNDNDDTELPPVGKPRSIPKNYIISKLALQLGKNYANSDFDCLDEKGKDFLTELNSLNIKEYPFAVAALCRALLENTLKHWSEEETSISFKSNDLPGTYNSCLNVLLSKKVITPKEHTTLKTTVNK